MGRYDFRNVRVHDTASLFLKTARNAAPPPWYSVITEYPPSAALVRPQPVHHHARTNKLKKYRKPSKMFMPQTLGYAEDELRTTFFSDHPWELARPRILLEEDGKDGQRWDWSKEYEVGRPVNGESVVQRQMYLMNVGPPSLDAETKKPLHDARGRPLHTPLSRAAAYDKARKELYERRHKDEVADMIQAEEARAVGAQFGMGPNEIGMQLEGKAFDEWKEWATQQAVIQEQARSAAYGGTTSQSDSDGPDLGDVLGALGEGEGEAEEGESAATP